LKKVDVAGMDSESEEDRCAKEAMVEVERCGLFLYPRRSRKGDLRILFVDPNGVMKGTLPMAAISAGSREKSKDGG
jgi:hypothetical protein